MTRRTWTPGDAGPSAGGAEATERYAELAYVVVDERIGGVATLSVSDWPRLDARGRLTLPDGLKPTSVAIVVADLQRYLEAYRQPRRNIRRPVRIGDVYGIELQPHFRKQLLAAADGSDADDGTAIAADPDRDFTTHCLDITADARDAAKVAFFGAVAPVVRREDDPVLRLVTPEPDRG